jgi:hypothetical protein
MCKTTFGKNIIDVLQHISSGNSLMELQNDSIISGNLKLDYNKLLYKLVKVTEKSPIEIFLLARTEKGFGWNDKAVEKHCDQYLKGFQELPNYVEAFIDDGKEFIINS